MSEVIQANEITEYLRQKRDKIRAALKRCLILNYWPDFFSGFRGDPSVIRETTEVTKEKGIKDGEEIPLEELPKTFELMRSFYRKLLEDKFGGRENFKVDDWMDDGERKSVFAWFRPMFVKFLEELGLEITLELEDQIKKVKGLVQISEN